MRYEWRMLRADRATRIFTGIFVLLLAGGLVNGFLKVDAQQRAVIEAKREQQKSYDETFEKVKAIERKNISYEYDGNSFRPELPAPSAIKGDLSNFHAALPPASYAVFSIGQMDARPQVYNYQPDENSTHTTPLSTGENKFLNGLYAEQPTANPLAQKLGQFDVAFVILYFFPLLILAFTFDLIAAERESGTLTLLLSQQLNLRTLVIGKIATRFLLIVGCAVVFPILAAQIWKSSFPTGAELVVLSFWSLVVILYGVFWLGLAALINAFGNYAITNALILITIWTLVVIVLPTVTVFTIAPPASSSLEFTASARSIPIETYEKSISLNRALDNDFKARFPAIENNAQNLEMRRRAWFDEIPSPQNENQLMATFFRNHPEWKRELTYRQFQYAVGNSRVEYVEAETARLREKLNATRNNQNRSLFAALPFFSPTNLLQVVMDEIAGTSKARHQRFLSQLDDYIRQRTVFFNSKALKQEPVTADEIEQLSKFEFRDQSLSETSERFAFPFIGLIVFSVILIVFGINTYNRYRIVG